MAWTGNSTDTRGVHDALIAAFVADHPTAKTTGFMKALRNLPDAEYTRDLMANDADWRARVSIVPDAYVIDPEERTIAIFEAVVTSDITDEKMDKIAEIAWAVDQDFYSVGVIRGTTYGRALFDPIEDSIARVLPLPDIEAEIDRLREEV